MFGFIYVTASLYSGCITNSAAHIYLEHFIAVDVPKLLGGATSDASKSLGSAWGLNTRPAAVVWSSALRELIQYPWGSTTGPSTNMITHTNGSTRFLKKHSTGSTQYIWAIIRRIWWPNRQTRASERRLCCRSTAGSTDSNRRTKASERRLSCHSTAGSTDSNRRTKASEQLCCHMTAESEMYRWRMGWLVWGITRCKINSFIIYLREKPSKQNICITRSYT